MISLLIPVLNEEENIPLFLKHILAQKIKPEIIFADGGSSDNTVKIIENYATNKNLRIKLLKLDKQGTGYAINEAFKVASGEYIVHAGADWRFIDSDIFKDIEDFAKQNKADVIKVKTKAKIRPDLGIIKNSLRFWDFRGDIESGFSVIRNEVFPEFPNISYGEDKIASQRLREKNPTYAILRKEFSYERGSYEQFELRKLIKRYIWYGKTFNLYLKESKDPQEYLRIAFAVLSVFFPPLLIIPALVGIISSLDFVRVFPALILTFPVIAASSTFFMGIGYLLHFIEKNTGHL